MKNLEIYLIENSILNLPIMEFIKKLVKRSTYAVNNGKSLSWVMNEIKLERLHEVIIDGVHFVIVK